MGNTPREREKRVDDDEAMTTMLGDNSGPAMGGDRRRGGAGWRWLGFRVHGDQGAWSALGLPRAPYMGGWALGRTTPLSSRLGLGVVFLPKLLHTFQT
jgi:hypothetical protein